MACTCILIGRQYRERRNRWLFNVRLVWKLTRSREYRGKCMSPKCHRKMGNINLSFIDIGISDQHMASLTKALQSRVLYCRP